MLILYTCTYTLNATCTCTCGYYTDVHVLHVHVYVIDVRVSFVCLWLLLPPLQATMTKVSAKSARHSRARPCRRQQSNRRNSKRYVHVRTYVHQLWCHSVGSLARRTQTYIVYISRCACSRISLCAPSSRLSVSQQLWRYCSRCGCTSTCIEMSSSTFRSIALFMWPNSIRQKCNIFLP